MSGSSVGRIFKATTWGESHGPGVGVIVDGCPAGIDLSATVIQSMLDRRRPGATIASTPRREKDGAAILSGVFEGLTTGTPIMIMVENQDADPSAYAPHARFFRPGHGDITYQAKYGRRDWRGGGRASARETVGRVAAGAVAGVMLAAEGIHVRAYTLELGGIRATQRDMTAVDRNPWGCPDLRAAEQMTARVREVRQQGDSIGGIVELIASHVPPGLGEPVFDKLDADLAKALMSIGAIKGVEIGAGFGSATSRGSENNDPILPEGFASNNAGGILAGISNGDQIIVRAAVKPIPSIAISQSTVDVARKPQTISIQGRHDVAAIPRINVVCEAMVNLVLADHLLRQRAVTRWVK